DDFLHERAAELGIDVRNFMEMGNLLLAKDYLRANQIRRMILQDFERVFQDVDVLITPVTATTAKRPKDHPIFINVNYTDGYSEDVLWAWCRYTMPISMAGTPVCVVPCGFDRNNLPIAMQVVAPAFDEQTALRVAYSYEQATDWHSKKPLL
ncbi:MAG: amidase family protein, partial [Candidatus Bathyarchaeia archaeon]